MHDYLTILLPVGHRADNAGGLRAQQTGPLGRFFVRFIKLLHFVCTLYRKITVYHYRFEQRFYNDMDRNGIVSVRIIPITAGLFEL